MITKQNIEVFIQIQNQKQPLMKVILMMNFNHYIVRLYQIYKNL